MTQGLSNNARFRSILALVISAALVLGTAADAAVGVRTSKTYKEVTPAADVVGGKRFIGWGQLRRRNFNGVNAFVKRGGRKPVRLNRSGTEGWMGGIDGQVAVYQEARKRDSDIYRFNLRTRDRAGIKVNSPKWEYSPTISGNFILLGQMGPKDKVVLFNKKTGDSRTLAKVNSSRGDPRVQPGQVHGDYATLQRCSAGYKTCDVIRYRISTRDFMTIPSKRPFQYAASVMPNGTVYFGGSGKACGANTAIYRRRGNSTTRIAKLGGTNELFFGPTFASPRPGGGTDVYYSRGPCKNASEYKEHANFDILRANG
jgi:hypothetical protein